MSKEKRKEFERTKWVTNRVNLMFENPKADPDCKSCNGHGVIDEGHFTGSTLINCSDCWIEK